MVLLRSETYISAADLAFSAADQKRCVQEKRKKVHNWEAGQSSPRKSGFGGVTWEKRRRKLKQSDRVDVVDVSLPLEKREREDEQRFYGVITNGEDAIQGRNLTLL